MWQSFRLLEIKKYEKLLIQWLSYWIIYALLWKLEILLMSVAHDFFSQ